MHNRLRVCLIYCDVVAGYQLFLPQKVKTNLVFLVVSQMHKHVASKNKETQVLQDLFYKRHGTAIFNGKQQQNATLIKACKSKCICLCLHLLTTLQPRLFARDRLMETSQKNIFFSRDFRNVLKIHSTFIGNMTTVFHVITYPCLIHAGNYC